MSRISIRFAVALIALVALVAVFAVPGALARSAHHKTHGHHAKKSHRRSEPSGSSTHKTGDSHTGATTGSGSGEHPSGSGEPQGGDNHPAPPVPTTPPPPTPPAPVTATGNGGTVASFTGGVLVINLTAGGTVTGGVNGDTKVVCRPAPAAHTRTDAPAGGDHPTTPPTTTTTTATAPPPPPSAGTLCGATALVAGAVVHEATLVTGPAGAHFTSIVIFTSST